MKGSNAFFETIKNYIEDNIENTEKHSNKSVENCCNYIITTVEKSGCNGFTDAEIYGMVNHYYDEPNESLGEIKDLNSRCVVNHIVELTEEEKQQAKDKALEEIKQEQINKLKSKEIKNQQKNVKTEQLDLFA